MHGGLDHRDLQRTGRRLMTSRLWKTSSGELLLLLDGFLFFTLIRFSSGLLLLVPTRCRRTEPHLHGGMYARWSSGAALCAVAQLAQCMVLSGEVNIRIC